MSKMRELKHVRKVPFYATLLIIVVSINIGVNEVVGWYACYFKAHSAKYVSPLAYIVRLFERGQIVLHYDENTMNEE